MMMDQQASSLPRGGHRVSTPYLQYKRAIVHAIGELQDYHLRSSIDSIRRHAQTAMEQPNHHYHSDQHEWNETMFLKTLKGMVEAGEIEHYNPSTSTGCELSPELKKQMTSKAQQMIHAKHLLLQQQSQESYYGFPSSPPPVPTLQRPFPQHPSFSTTATTMTGGSPTYAAIAGGSDWYPQQQQQQYHRGSFGNSHHCQGSSHSPHHHGHHHGEKEAPAKKTEHFKLKIVPKKLYDQQHVPIHNPMDTH